MGMLSGMVSLPACVGVLTVLYAVYYYRCYAHYLAEAKQSGIPYVVVPIRMHNMFWHFIVSKYCLILLRKLPTSWTHSWLDFVDPEWDWSQHHKLFARVGSDIFIACSPGGNMVWVAHPESISQVLSRPKDFLKPPGLSRVLDIYGPNVLTSEGALWRRHRKIIAPQFHEENTQLVWTETLQQCQSMLGLWLRGCSGENKPGYIIGQDVMRLSLHVISKAGFGIGLTWGDSEEAEEATGDVPTGHKMSFREALGGVLHDIFSIALIPSWVMKSAPNKSLRKAYQTYEEWAQYMKEMLAAKKQEIKKGTDEQEEGMDLMGALIKGAGNKSFGPKNGVVPSESLSDEEILGNLFVLLFAGHETTANSIHYSILYLALHTAAQSRLQKDLDGIFGDRPISEWDFHNDLPKLQAGMAGAILNEELRLIAPLIIILKRTHRPQPITIDSKPCVIPGNAPVLLVTSAVHRNTNYWPSNTSSSDPYVDLDQFRPDRWLIPNEKAGADAITENEISTFYRPQKGAYIPFSEGVRACVGRRFADTEVFAALAVIFKQYSIELAVDKWASDAEVANMDKTQRKELWNTAAESATKCLTEGITAEITLQIRKGEVPIRIVKRGEERFL